MAPVRPIPLRPRLIVVSRPAVVREPTEDQRAILHCIWRGLTNRGEIAHELGLTEYEVRQRLQRLYRRLGVGTRNDHKAMAHAITVAHARGYVGR